MEKISGFFTYGAAALLAWIGELSLKDLSTILGVVIGGLMLVITWHYKRKTYLLLKNKMSALADDILNS